MRIILDCNIWISFLIGHQTRWIQQILTDTRYDVYVCDELLEEIQNVSSRSKIMPTSAASLKARVVIQVVFHIVAV